MANKERNIPIDTIGGKIRARRKELKITKIQLYDQVLGDNRTSADNKADKVDKWEINSNIRADELSGICRALNVDADYLLGRIKEHDHNLKTVCEITHLSEAAASRLSRNNDLDPTLLSQAVSTLLESEDICSTLLELFYGSEVRSKTVGVWPVAPESAKDLMLVAIQEDGSRKIIKDPSIDLRTLMVYSDSSLAVRVGDLKLTSADLRRSRYDKIISELERILEAREKAGLSRVEKRHHSPI